MSRYVRDVDYWGRFTSATAGKANCDLIPKEID